LLYKDYTYDAEDPWKGLLRSSIMVKVRKWLHWQGIIAFIIDAKIDFQAYIYFA